MELTTEYLIDPVSEKRNRRISAALTAILIMLLLIIAFLIVLNRNEPDFPPEGILISFGTTEEGSGDIEPTIQEKTAQATPSTPQPVESVDEINPTSDINATEVKTKQQKKPVEPVKTPEKTPETKPQEQKVEEKKIDDTKLFKGGNPTQNPSQSQGRDLGALGNEGDPTGGAKPGLSTGDGAFELGGGLKGRGWALSPDKDRINHNLSATETMVLEIEVDPSGRVKVLRIGRGNEVTDPAIQQMVIREVERARVNPGNTSVRGTVTFILKPR